MTNHNDKHETTCARRAAAHELFALKISISGNYAGVCPLHFEREKRGEGTHGKTVADVRITVSFSIICVIKKFIHFFSRSYASEKKYRNL